ncbi:MAG: N-acetylmuramoyl-L-alanine amidase [Verrucomicrobiales bacterium]|nr:N-acetylmuramoyl-L-alanine amidase [Verrucomicrobiales bacterium]
MSRGNQNFAGTCEKSILPSIAVGTFALLSFGSETPARAETTNLPSTPAAEEISIPKPWIARLGQAPNWSLLEPYQETITREEFVYLLQHCYARSPKEYAETIQIFSDRALILKQSNHPEKGWFVLRFRTDPALPRPAPKFWRSAAELPDLPENTTRPLEGLRVAIDPGHIGGDWVTWDDRHFKIGRDTIEVREGEMTLKVAKILERDLTLLGANVFLTRSSNNPVTEERVETLQQEARDYLRQRKRIPSDKLLASTAKAMFAISSEIRARADLLNESIQPDVALCLHFNASPWVSRRPSFRSPNHLHLLINGCYSEGEIREDDTRFEMIMRILQRVYQTELELSDEISRTMKSETRLPAFHYDGTSGMSVNENELVWARNLLANRVFFCPVIFFEPYCMNHREIHARVQEGAYEGLREINGIYRKNIYQEYADGVTAGLVHYYRKKR